MPLVYIPTPRQFHYEPRFYDPKKERWEELKRQKEAEQLLAEAENGGIDGKVSDIDTTGDATLEYYQRRIAELESDERRKSRKLTWKDMFRKREMPTFNYKPRFNTETQTLVGNPPDTATERVEEVKQRNIRIKRRFDVNRTLQRKQQTVWIKVALVLIVFWLVYRYYGAILQFFYNLFF